MHDIPESLREKKHLETRRAIELAAVDLVRQKGMTNTTVESISACANISRRTFFNYYDCKEDAVLGLLAVSRHTSDSCVLELLSTESALEFLVRALLAMFEHGVSDISLKKQRVELIRANPCLLERQLDVMSKMSKEFIDVAHQMLNKQFGGKITRDQAEVVLILCYGAVKVVIKNWLAAGKNVPYKNINLQAVELVEKTVGVIYVKG